VSERAVWRRGPDERTTWLAYLDADRERYLGESLRGVGCVTGLGALFILFSGHPITALGLLAVTLLLPIVRRPRRRDVTPLLTLPAPAPAHPCTIEVVDGDSILGRDRGTVTFIDGWLHYEGFRTGFSLSRADVVKRDRNALSLDGCQVAFSPDGSGFDTELDRWYRIAPAAQGVTILPPHSLHPSGRVRAQADLAVHAVLGIVSSALCVALFVYGESWEKAAAFLVGLRFVGSAMEVRNAARFLRKRRSPPNVAQDGDGLPSKTGRRNR